MGKPRKRTSKTNDPVAQPQKAGREIAKNAFSSLVSKTGLIISGSDMSDHVALMTYGSAGGLFFLGNSDTDFILLDDGTVPEAKLIKLQDRIYNYLARTTWSVGFKSWERVKANPMDLLSTRFLSGNINIFNTRIFHDEQVNEVNSEYNHIAILASIDLHLEFMSSTHFSRLVRTYHPTEEFPEKICRGDVKYFTGGIRWIQAIFIMAMVYSKKQYLYETDLKILVSKQVFSKQEAEEIQSAMDFFLTAKSLCIRGNNILLKENLTHILSQWNKTADEIEAAYIHHTYHICSLLKKAHQVFLQDFSSFDCVMARTTSDSQQLSQFVDTDSLELWKTIALRCDVQVAIKEKLKKKILETQQKKPHTMLDEMVAMLEFSESDEPKSGFLREIREETSLWLTDQVFDYFDRTLKKKFNDPVLIRLAVHASFFNLYKAGKIPDPDTFYLTYINRVKKFFHCRSIEPVKPLQIAITSCEQMLRSGLFQSNRIALMELHLTNRCNLSCSWCTYKSENRNQSILFTDIDQVIVHAPMEILIAGGGEPTLYTDNGNDLNDVIHYLRNSLPGTRLRLITNGTFIPQGGWLSEIDEISISLDNECAESFQSNKGSDLFMEVWRNIQYYLLKSPVTMIRVTRIYNKNNVFDSFILAENLYRLWERISEEDTKKDYFKFMLFPMAMDQDQSSPYAGSLLTEVQKAGWDEHLSRLRRENKGFYSFLKKHTNIPDLSRIEPSLMPAEKCWPVTHYFLFGADRRVYPCFAACSSFPITALGKVDLSPDVLTRVRENLFLYPPLQCKSGCRPGSVFYGALSKIIYLDKVRLDLPNLAKIRKKRRSIVHVSYQDPDCLAGGQGWAVYNLIREQVNLGEMVYWISPCIKDEKPGEYLFEGGRLRVIKIRFTKEIVSTLYANEDEVHFLRIKFGDAFVKFIKEHFTPRNCFIHLHGFIETPRRSKELRKAGYTVISTFHMLLSSRNRHLQVEIAMINHLREFEHAAIGANSLVSVPSKGMIDELLDIHPGYKGSIIHVKNGIAEEFVTTPLPLKEPNQNLIVSYGRISPEKGFELFIEAAKIMITKRSHLENQLQFVLFGNTDYTIGSRRKYAEDLIGSVSSFPAIRVLASRQGLIGPEKLKMIDQAFVGVVPSYYEPFGMVIPEMMARGIPVITTLTTGASEIFRTNRLGKNDFGFIVKSDPESFANALEWIIAHPSEATKMGQNAHERAKHYRWNEVAIKFNSLYKFSSTKKDNYAE